jgi:hypothetical protein
MDDGRVWVKSMAETLERLDRACTGRPGGAGGCRRSTRGRAR